MLRPGAHIGSFEVLAPLGAGGMGEVYRARDPRLGREVAIKVLPADSLADEVRRRRFVQEARAASALNHPHIVTIHEIESSNGMDFIVMEYVPGQTLDLQIPKGGMPVREALRLAIPIADALTAAHARGIVHRDVKPSNVVVSDAGVVKVLDFGLAKLVASGADEPGQTLATLTSPEPLSHPGSVAGTAAYMSPEQATGGMADARSDIFAFGVVLYELLTGRRPFLGASVSEVRAAVVRDHPQPPRELAPGISEALERIVLRCLRKEPERRFQHMGDVKLELVELGEESRSDAWTRADADARPRFRRGRIAWVAAGALATALVAGWTLWRSRSSSPPPTVVQLSSERWAVAGSFSPDGSQIAYASPGEDGLNWDIWLKIVGQPNVRRLTTDPTAEHYPAWSPDGTQIAFLRYGEIRTRGQAVSLFATGQVYLMSALGGSARRMTDLPAWLQLSWSPDGTWLAAAKARTASDPPGGIHIISIARGESHAVTFPKPPGFDHSPSFSPDGRSLAYASCGGPPGAPACSVYVLSLDADQRPQATAGPLTRQRQQIRGLTWSRDGRSIVYSSGSPADADRGLFRVQARGGTPPERIELGRLGEFPSLGGSPERLAFARVSSERDIYRWRFGEGAAGLIQSTLWETHPQYSPDGRRIAFESNRTDGGTEIWLADADGSNPTRLTRGPGNYQGSPGWSPDGRSIVFDSRAENSQVDIWTVSSDGTGLRQITRGPKDAIVPSYSRDGRFIYFSSNRRGRSEIFRVAGSGGREEQVTSAGGIQPFESRDGQTLYYLRDRSGRSPVLARPTRGGEERTILSCASLFNYAVASKGILHVACDSAGPGRFALLDWDAGTGRDRLIATLDADFVQGLSVSPDGQSVLYMRGTESSDLMMIENFR